MKDTPCLQCQNLRLLPRGYYCNSIKEVIDTKIVDRTEIAGLPNCPDFVRAPIASFPLPLIREDKTETETVLVKRKYTRPEVVKTETDTRQEIIAIIKDFHARRQKWPTHRQVYLLSRFRSLGEVYNILNAMVDDKLLVKKAIRSGRAKHIYSVR